MKERHVFFFAGLMILLLDPSSATAASRTESHTLTSAILAEAGIKADRQVLVDLPDGYDTSGLRYPAIYLIHGLGTDPGLGPSIMGSATSSAHKLIVSGQIPPVILVRPNLSRGTPGRATGVYFEEYLAQEVVPFVDATYRTVPVHHGRAIAGWSLGGTDAMFSALTHPNLFSMIGSYAGAFDIVDIGWPMSRLRTHPQNRFPLQFWFWWGRNDFVTKSPRPIIDFFEALHWPHFYLENDANHNGFRGPMEQSLLFFAPRLWEAVYANEYHLSTVTQAFNAVAGDPDQTLDIEVVLQPPTDQSTPHLSVDLSALGETAPLALTNDGDGHYTGRPRITVPQQPGLYRLPVLQALGDKEPQSFFQIHLQVFPRQEQGLFTDAEAPALEEIRLVTLNPQATGQVFEGNTSLEVQARPPGFDFALHPSESMASFGAVLRFAFHPGDTQPTRFALTLEGSQGGRRSVVFFEDREGLSKGDLYLGLDLAQPTWQVIEIPLAALNMSEPIQSLQFSGRLQGTFYLDDIHLVPQTPPSGPTVEAFTPTFRFSRGTEALTFVEGTLPPAIQAKVQLERPLDEQAPTLVLDGAEVGADQAIQWAYDGGSVYTAAVPVPADLPNGLYTLPVHLVSANRPPEYFMPLQLQVFPAQERVLYADDALLPAWVAGGTAVVTLNPQATDPFFEGQTSLAVEPQRSSIYTYLTWKPDRAVFGYNLRFAFYPGPLDESGDSPLFQVRVQSDWGPSTTALLEAANPPLDLQQQAWQQVEIPLGDRPIQSIAFVGKLKGTLYLDEIRLVPQPLPAPSANTAVLETRQNTTPEDFTLAQNFPNPFNSSTVIRFSLPQPEDVELTVYNLAGQEVIRLVDGSRAAGSYTVGWDGRDDQDRPLSSGLYLYRLRAGQQTTAHKLLLLK